MYLSIQTVNEIHIISIVFLLQIRGLFSFTAFKTFFIFGFQYLDYDVSWYGFLNLLLEQYMDIELTSFGIAQFLESVGFFLLPNLGNFLLLSC